MKLGGIKGQSVSLAKAQGSGSLVSLALVAAIGASWDFQRADQKIFIFAVQSSGDSAPPV